eukprot:XP_001700363.1 predicted protein [Chlamydomonas reinhardtii]
MGKVTAAAREKLERLRVQGRDGANQKEVFICWAITNAFQYLQRRKRAGFVASVSSISLRDLVRTYGQWQVDYLVGAVETVLAPGGTKSGSTDAKLLQRVNAFIQAQSASGAAPRSVLLRGDGPRQRLARRLPRLPGVLDHQQHNRQGGAGGAARTRRLAGECGCQLAMGSSASARSTSGLAGLGRDCWLRLSCGHDHVQLYLASLPAVLGAADRAAALQAMGDWLQHQKARRTACYKGLCRMTAGRGCTLEVPCSHGSGLHQAATASIILRLQPGSSRNPVIALTAALERLRGALSQACLEVPQAAAASTRAGPAKPNGSGPGRIMFVRLASIEGVMDMPLSQRVRAVRLFSDWLQLQVARHAQCYLQLCNAVDQWGYRLVVPTCGGCGQQDTPALILSLKRDVPNPECTLGTASERLQEALNTLWQHWRQSKDCAKETSTPAEAFTAGECGCQLAMGSSASARSTSGLAGLGRDCWLRLSCGHDVGEDAEHCRHIAKRAWHRLRQELEGALAQQAHVQLYLASLPAVLGAADRAAALQAMGDWLQHQKARRTACYEGLCRMVADRGCKLEVPCFRKSAFCRPVVSYVTLECVASGQVPETALATALADLREALSGAGGAMAAGPG